MKFANHHKTICDQFSWNFLALLTGFLLSTFNVVFGQFNPQSFDKKLLEHEIKILIDSTRLAHKLPALYSDSILYVASNHHANYLVSLKALSHQEIGKKEFLNPQDRANFYGAPKNYFVGENIAFTVYNASVKSKDKIFVTTNYQEIARSLVHSWVNSKGHFKNIIEPDYQVTGLAIGIDPTLNRIYACQKFAQVLYRYEFKESKSFFPYSDLNNLPALTTKQYPKQNYPYNLKDDKQSKCQECKSIWEQYPAISVRVSKNNFILRIEDASFAQQLLQNRFDGFAIEIVPFDAFACGNPAYSNEPSRRNKQKMTSGPVLEPIYRDDLIKGFKKRKKIKGLTFVKYIFSKDSVSFFKRFGRYKLNNFSASYFEFKLGKVPKNIHGWWNHNLMYIHEKQICHFIYLTNYPGELNLELIDVAYFPPVPVNDYKFKLDLYTDSLELKYKAGQTESIGTGLANLIKRFEENDLKIKLVQIEGFASVEGDSLKNVALHQARTNEIFDKLAKLTDYSTSYEIKSEIAWKHFYASVEKHPKWKFLYPLSKREIIAYLVNPKNEKPTEILDQERKVKIKVFAVKELTPKTAKYYISRDIDNLYIRNAKRELECTNSEQLEKLYEKAYYFTTVDTLKEADFLKISFPKTLVIPTHRLEHDVAFYRYHLLKDKVSAQEKIKLESEVERVFVLCNVVEHLSPEFHYLSSCLLTEKIKSKGAKMKVADPMIQKAFDRMNTLLSGYVELDSIFYLNVAKTNLNVIQTICKNIDPDLIYEYGDIVNASLIQIYQYYKRTNQLNPEKTLNLAQTFCYFNNVQLAATICKDFIYDTKVLKFYLPLIYNHNSFLTSDPEIEFEAEFQRLLLEAKSKLSPADWCKLFYGEFGIPFQVMDNSTLHDEFCKTCPNRVEEVFGE